MSILNDLGLDNPSKARLKELGILYANASSENFYKTFTYTVSKDLGITIGNALRRTLFAKVPGYAIRYFVIKGISHEFIAVPGLKESAQELIMNLRKIVFSGDLDSTKLSLNVSKEGAIFASEVKGSLNIVNENLYIATLNKGFDLKVEMYVEKNIGIILANDVKNHNYESDAIICDSFFGPIEHINYEVSPIENNNKEEILTVSVTTNGSIKPENALEFAFKVLQNEMSKMFDFERAEQNTISSKKVKITDQIYSNRVDAVINDSRILNCLNRLGVIYVGELVRLTNEDLINNPNFGASSLNKLNEILGTYGLSLGMDINWEKSSIINENEEGYIG